MGYRQRNKIIAANEDLALNEYLKQAERRENLCAMPCCMREAYLEYKGEKYCRYCYEDLKDREGMDALDQE